LEDDRSKAILFDLDGTLIDTTELILYCFNHAWETVCGRTHPAEVFVATMGIPLKVAMHRLLEPQRTAARQIGELNSQPLKAWCGNDPVTLPITTVWLVLWDGRLWRGCEIGDMRSAW
jgi:phosphoglycolate phosphatase-like HAD superfamily hydrolase